MSEHARAKLFTFDQAKKLQGKSICIKSQGLRKDFSVKKMIFDSAGEENLILSMRTEVIRIKTQTLIQSNDKIIPNEVIHRNETVIEDFRQCDDVYFAVLSISGNVSVFDQFTEQVLYQFTLPRTTVRIITSAVFDPFRNPTILRQEGDSLKVEDIAATGIDGQVQLPPEVENIIGTLEG